MESTKSTKSMRALRAAAALSLALTLGALAAPEPAQAAEAAGAYADMHRLYNPNSGEHFYTASADEKESLVSAGWNDEGIGWVAPAESATPVYRLYNPNPDPATGSGEHHYTISADERDCLVSEGWLDEGVGWYSDDAKGVAVYRQYNPNQYSNNHNYTAGADERDYLVGLGWNDEGVGWYGSAHEHDWEAQTSTVHHDAVTHEEPVYEEKQVQDTFTGWWYHYWCANCGTDVYMPVNEKGCKVRGKDPTYASTQYYNEYHAEHGNGYWTDRSNAFFWHVEYNECNAPHWGDRDYIYKTWGTMGDVVWATAEVNSYHTEKSQVGSTTVVDHEAYDEIVTTYVCSECGAVKQ